MLHAETPTARTSGFLQGLTVAVLAAAFLAIAATTVAPSAARADGWADIRNQAAIATAYNFSPLPANAGEGVTVAVLTTGISPRLEGWLGSRGRSENFVPTEPAHDLHGFGSHSVSILAALAPKATIISLKVLLKNGKSKFGIVAKGIERATALGAKIIVIPLGAGPNANYPGITQAVAGALEKGIMVVAAAGNAGKPQISYPANLDGVIAVGATDPQDNLAGYSNHGGKIIYAPGNDVIALWRDKLRPISGTTRSLVVAGAIYAVLWSQRPHATARQIADTVARTAKTIFVKGAQAKRIDGAAALAALR